MYSENQESFHRLKVTFVEDVRAEIRWLKN